MSTTLEILDGERWEEPTYDSGLVATLHRLRKKPLDAFTVEDLRIVLGQRLSAEHLIPQALDVLDRDPLAEGDFFPGDLFVNVIGQREAFWQDHPELENRAVGVANHLLQTLRDIWQGRKDEARRLYGATLDDESASHKNEQRLEREARHFIATRSSG